MSNKVPIDKGPIAQHGNYMFWIGFMAGVTGMALAVSVVIIIAEVMS